MNDRIALVTGATGAIGKRVVPALLEAGWSVRVLSRSPKRLDARWRDKVDVVVGDATDPDAVRKAMAGATVAYYLLHSMDGRGDFLPRDRQLAHTFADAAAATDGLRRIVYLSGLHDPAAKLSPHMASRVEVGDILLASGVPTAVLQAGVVLGADSASFKMLRHLSERLPAAIGPKWLSNHIQPVAIDDVVHYLVHAAELPPEINRTLDVTMDEVLTYADMMRRYAKLAGLRSRLIVTVPILTPNLASHWVGLVTPVPAGIARPLVGSLIHDAVRHENDIAALLPEPPGGRAGFDEAVRRALVDVDPTRWQRTLTGVALGVGAAAVAGSVLTDASSGWYQRLLKPAWQPPAAAFPIVWTSLYTAVTLAGAATIADLGEKGRDEQATKFGWALAANLALNATWSGLFFRLHQLPAATVGAAALAASGADLTRRAKAAGTSRAVAFGAYTAWCAFATVLSGTVAALNPQPATRRG